MNSGQESVWTVLKRRAKSLAVPIRFSISNRITDILPLYELATHSEFPIRDPFNDMQQLLDSDVQSVVDAGAAEGDTVARLLSEFPGATIHAFEPRANAFETLKKRFADEESVQCHRLAVGRESAQATLNVTESIGWSSLLDPKPDFDQETTVTGTETVQVRRLDEVVGDIDVLKLDLQGFELNALRGATELLDEAEAILTEISFKKAYNEQPSFCDISKFLSGYEFQLYNLYNLYIVPGDAGETTGGDALFVRQEVLNSHKER